MLIFILGAAFAGLVASFLSSVFGGGFGLLFVPAIYWLLTHYYTDLPHTMQVTIATCALCSIPLGLAASIKQIKYKNFDRKLYKDMVISMTIGALAGAYLATIINSTYLKYIFAIIVFITAIWMLRFKAEQSKEMKLPTLIYKGSAGLIGILTTLTGVAVFGVPFFVITGVDIKKAIGTSTVLVFTYCGIAAIWFIMLGLPTIGISWHQLGYANLIVFISTLIPCILGSILGAKMVHILPAQLLKKLFIAMMFIVSITMLL